MDYEKVEAAIPPKPRRSSASKSFGHPGGMVELEQLAHRHELLLIRRACEGSRADGSPTPRRDRTMAPSAAGVYAFLSPTSNHPTVEGGK